MIRSILITLLFVSVLLAAPVELTESQLHFLMKGK